MKRTIVHAAAIVLAAAIATPAMAGDIKVKGKIFYDYGLTSITKGGAKTTTTGGNLARTYLTAKHKWDNTWSTRLTLDSGYEKDDKKKSQVYVKYAKLTGKFMPALNVKMGVIDTPWIGYVDKLGKHRYISKTFVDKQKLDHSADAGVAVFGKIADGFAHYDVALVNGAGYGNTKRNGTQDISSRVGIAPVKGLTLDLGYRSGYKGSKGDTNATGTKQTLIQAMATYGVGKSFRAGGTFIKSEIDSVKGTGLETWVWANFSDKIGAYANFETYDSGKTGKVKETRMVASIDYKANKKVLVSLAYTGVSDLKGVSGDKETIIGMYTQYKF